MEQSAYVSRCSGVCGCMNNPVSEGEHFWGFEFFRTTGISTQNWPSPLSIGVPGQIKRLELSPPCVKWHCEEKSLSNEQGTDFWISPASWCPKPLLHLLTRRPSYWWAKYKMSPLHRRHLPCYCFLFQPLLLRFWNLWSVQGLEFLERCTTDESHPY